MRFLNLTDLSAGCTTVAPEHEEGKATCYSVFGGMSPRKEKLPPKFEENLR
jgi:hypothetical protein